eukprot:2051818-Rhodomonas_salina.1
MVFDEAAVFVSPVVHQFLTRNSWRAETEPCAVARDCRNSFTSACRFRVVTVAITPPPHWTRR